MEFIASGKSPEQVLAFQIVCLILCRAYTVQNVRHLYHVPVLTFLLMLVTGIAGGSMLFPLIFLFHVATLAPLLVALLNLEEQQIAGEFCPTNEAGHVAEQPVRAATCFRHYLKVAITGIAATIGVFSTLPMLGPGATQVPGVQGGYHSGSSSTGLSEFLTLDRLSSLKRDMTEVMRVRVLGSAFTEEQFYLKGYVLEDFRPQTMQWRRMSEQDQEQIRVSGDRVELPFQADEPQASVILVTQEIRLVKPSSAGVLFGLPGLRGVAGISGVLRVDKSGNCSFRSPEEEPVTEYRVFSDYAKQFAPRSGSGVQLDAAAVESQGCLAYPEGGVYDRIQLLARDICVSADADSVRARALAIQKHLIAGYQYRLDGRSLRSRNPLESFLFRDKTGHCELFAGAMALMLRSCGVPSRIVLGYHGGTLDAAANEFVIRQADAHAWVEAHLPNAGWVAFDPTPPVPMQSYGERIAFKFLKDAAARVGLHWRRYFGDNQPVHPDTVDVLRNFGAFVFANKAMSHPVLVDVFERVSDASADGNFRSLTVSLVFLNAAAITLVFLHRRRRQACGATSSPVSDRVLKSILRQLADGRHERIPRGVTAQEFVVRVALGRLGHVPGSLEELMAMYHRFRFGPGRGSAPDWQRVQLLLRQMRRDLAPGRRI